VGDQRDLVIGMPMRRSRGYILNTMGMYGPGKRSFGHAGAGGSTGFADPDNGIGLGYAMNQMEAGLDRLPRSKKLVDALYACL
jgi:CubicO group peptidase (beta-lactamase class C family)